MKVTRKGQSIPGHWLLRVLSTVLGLKGQTLAIAQQLPHYNVAVLQQLPRVSHGPEQGMGC